MLRIITLNTGYGMFLTELMAYVDSHIKTTDVFCFQEIDSFTKKILDDTLSEDYTCVYATKYDGAEKFLLATYIKHELDVLDSRELLRNDKDTGFGLTCRVYEPGSDRCVAITNVHGFPRPGTKLDTAERIAQSAHLINSAETDVCHVFAGDFNLLPQTESIKTFAKHGFRDLIKEFNIRTTRNKVVWDRFPQNKQLFADYVFVKNATQAICKLRTDDVVVSDHLPLIFDLETQSLRYFKPHTRLVSNSGNTVVSHVLNAAN